MTVILKYASTTLPNARSAKKGTTAMNEIRCGRRRRERHIPFSDYVHKNLMTCRRRIRQLIWSSIIILAIHCLSTKRLSARSFVQQQPSELLRGGGEGEGASAPLHEKDALTRLKSDKVFRVACRACGGGMEEERGQTDITLQHIIWCVWLAGCVPAPLVQALPHSGSLLACVAFHCMLVYGASSSHSLITIITVGSDVRS